MYRLQNYFYLFSQPLLIFLAAVFQITIGTSNFKLESGRIFREVNVRILSVNLKTNNFRISVKSIDNIIIGFIISFEGNNDVINKHAELNTLNVKRCENQLLAKLIGILFIGQKNWEKRYKR